MWVNLDAFECEFGFIMKISQFQSKVLIYCVIKWDKIKCEWEVWWGKTSVITFLSFSAKILTFIDF